MCTYNLHAHISAPAHAHTHAHMKAIMHAYTQRRAHTHKGN